MDKAIKDKWLTALRSGEYKQRKNALRGAKLWDDMEMGHCCLGVLCDVLVKGGIGSWDGNAFRVTVQDVLKLPNGEAGASEMELYDDSVAYDSGVLPYPVARALGVTSVGDLDETVLIEEDAYETLACLNDSGLASFEVIADVIEEQF